MESPQSYRRHGPLYRVFFNDPCRCSDFQLRIPWFVSIIIVSLFLFVYGVGAFVNHIDAPGSQAEVMQIQADLSTMDICDVKSRDRIIWANTLVRTKQNYNAIWFFAPAIPDSWDAVVMDQLVRLVIEYMCRRLSAEEEF